MAVGPEQPDHLGSAPLSASTCQRIEELIRNKGGVAADRR